ncbi:putative sporulation protein YtaF [Natranaerovirga hydrolytica]|uniref:Putative sporulation protein YtaF n=1 Tax=Natranaerovirga hydrolytica TaxID=680378 RepID=A0A4V6NFI7_9FIRM|nr:sporulation membrane protein YtaF [Natranaerovirga hydrolytica]TCK98491.1 putative sporulation protein YtaF [Natranaerovirga hydrolytica]
MLFLFALSVSLDSLAVGISYGIKKIKISIISLFVILLLSSFSLMMSWLMGNLILSFVPMNGVKYLSSILLILLGLIYLIQAVVDLYYPSREEKIAIKQFQIKIFNIVIDIIREPSVSDIDHSGTIEIKEAFYIGTALAIDSLAIGFALSLYDFNIFLFLLCANLINFFLLHLGQWIGRMTSLFISEERLKIVSSCIIILLGIIRLF